MLLDMTTCSTITTGDMVVVVAWVGGVGGGCLYKVDVPRGRMKAGFSSDEGVIH